MENIRFLVLTVFFATMACSMSCEKKSKCCDCPSGCGVIEINTKECIMMCVDPYEVSINSVNKLKMENYTKKDIHYGSHFYMEYFNENNWIPIEWDFDFTDIGYTLFAGSAKESVMNIYSLCVKYNDSQKGKYRIKKELGEILFAEFEVK